MQQITTNLPLNDPFLQQSCDIANHNNPDGAKFEIRPTGNGRAAVFIVNGHYSAIKPRSKFRDPSDPLSHFYKDD